MAKATKQDFLLAVRKLSFTEPGSFGVGGKVGETRFRGIEVGETGRRFLDSTMVQGRVSGRLSGLEVCFDADVIEFRDFPVVTLSLSLHNPLNEDLHFDMLSLLRREFCGEAPVLVTEDGRALQIPAPPRPPKEAQAERPAPLPRFEEPCYYLAFEECTLYIECEQAKMVHTEPLGATLMLGKRDLTLAGGETLCLPKITLAVCEGGVERMKELLAAWREAHC